MSKRRRHKAKGAGHKAQGAGCNANGQTAENKEVYITFDMISPASQEIALGVCGTKAKVEEIVNA